MVQECARGNQEASPVEMVVGKKPRNGVEESKIKDTFQFNIVRLGEQLYKEKKMPQEVVEEPMERGEDKNIVMCSQTVQTKNLSSDESNGPDIEDVMKAKNMPQEAMEEFIERMENKNIAMDHQPDLTIEYTGTGQTMSVTGVKTNMDKANIEARVKDVLNAVNFVKQMCQEYRDKLVENSMSESEPRVTRKARRIYGVGAVQTKIGCFLTVKGDMLGGGQ